MIEDSFSGNREESKRGWMASVEAWTVRVGVSKGESELVCSKGKELPDRQEKSRRLNGLNNVLLLNAETRSTSALQVQYSIQPPICRVTQPLVCSDCKILRQFHRV